jgi:hypothetical protein
VLTDSEQAVAGPAELMAQLVASGKLEACLSRSFFRYTFARWESLGSDGCALESMRLALQDGGGIVDLVMAASLSDGFKQRVFE